MLFTDKQVLQYHGLELMAIVAVDFWHHNEDAHHKGKQLLAFV